MEKGGFMSLDLCLEADSTLTISTLSKALANAGAWEIEKTQRPAQFKITEQTQSIYPLANTLVSSKAG
ncbi:hypothetical protein TU80_12675 [Pseudomonas veronii]|jgi:hypothetical protein|nr:hypothetical protein PverR02_25750 [Pseudomonas veronii]KRP79240.1 hypothetical protein TU80_12675 [Pseudomonas veronii]OPK05286.1 hypothetical protein BZ164_05655 [Pseudomonas veronii]